MIKLIPFLFSLLTIIFVLTTAEVENQNEIQRLKCGRQGHDTSHKCFSPVSSNPEEDGASNFTVEKEKKEPIQSILSLLNEGNETLSLQKGPKDLILFIGNTGCGTTTLTKFVSGHSDDMGSFWSGNRFLIEDTGHLINSPNSTLESKTRFPTFFESKKSPKNFTFYDLPGFTPTLGSASEIASHLLTQRVIGDAERVKLIFVINHSSLKPGESRVDLKNLLQFATDFIKNPTKFHPAIALIATKVETRGDQIVGEMAEFIENLRAKIPEIFGDPDQRLRVTSLVNTLLSKDDNDSYNRLGYMPQPMESGQNLIAINPFGEDGWVKENLEKIIHKNLNWVTAADDSGQILVGPDGQEYWEEAPPPNFGLPLSPAAKYFVKKSADRIETRIGDLVDKIGGKIVTHFDGIVGDTVNNLNSLYDQLKSLKKMTHQLNYQLQLSSLSEYFEILRHTLTQNLAMNKGGGQQAEIEDDFDELENFQNYLKFLDKISMDGKIDVGAPRPASKKWTIALAKIVQHNVTHVVYVVGRNLNDKTQTKMSQIGTQLRRLYTERIEGAGDIDEKKVLDPQLQGDVENLNNFISKNLTTFNTFVNESRQCFNSLQGAGVHLESSLLSEWTFLTHDVDLFLPHGDETMPSPFKIVNWLRPLETLVRFLKKERAHLAQQIKDHEASGVLKDLLNNVTSARADFQKEMMELSMRG